MPVRRLPIWGYAISSFDIVPTPSNRHYQALARRMPALVVDAFAMNACVMNECVVVERIPNRKHGKFFLTGDSVASRSHRAACGLFSWSVQRRPLADRRRGIHKRQVQIVRSTPGPAIDAVSSIPCRAPRSRAFRRFYEHKPLKRYWVAANKHT